MASPPPRPVLWVVPASVAPVCRTGDGVHVNAHQTQYRYARAACRPRGLRATGARRQRPQGAGAKPAPPLLRPRATGARRGPVPKHAGRGRQRPHHDAYGPAAVLVHQRGARKRGDPIVRAVVKRARPPAPAPTIDNDVYLSAVQALFARKKGQSRKPARQRPPADFAQAGSSAFGWVVFHARRASVPGKTSGPLATARAAPPRPLPFPAMPRFAEAMAVKMASAQGCGRHGAALAANLAIAHVLYTRRSYSDANVLATDACAIFRGQNAQEQATPKGALAAVSRWSVEKARTDAGLWPALAFVQRASGLRP